MAHTPEGVDGAALAQGGASFLDQHKISGRLDIQEIQAPAFSRDEVLSRALKEMKGDDRYPGEVVQERYNGDWNAYTKDMAIMYGMV